MAAAATEPILDDDGLVVVNTGKPPPLPALLPLPTTLQDLILGYVAPEELYIFNLDSPHPAYAKYIEGTQAKDALKFVATQWCSLFWRSIQASQQQDTYCSPPLIIHGKLLNNETLAAAFRPAI